MNPVLLSGSAHLPLASAIAQEVGLTVGRSLIERFQDQELHVEVLEEVQGRGWYVIQSLSSGPPQPAMGGGWALPVPWRAGDE